jgi:hypothetical protein
MERKSLRIDELSHRHYGVTPEVSQFYHQAARVCLDRHHAPPREVSIVDNNAALTAEIGWVPTDDRARGAWGNRDDATEAGAYCVALANVELTRGLVAVRRAQGRTGADYYLGRAGTAVDDLENALRLEVSGTDEGNLSTIRQRLRQKLEQARRGDSNLPAIATVVGFTSLHVESADIMLE